MGNLPLSLSGNRRPMPSRTESPNGRMRKGSQGDTDSQVCWVGWEGSARTSAPVGGIHSSRAQARARGKEWYHLFWARASVQYRASRTQPGGFATTMVL